MAAQKESHVHFKENFAVHSKHEPFYTGGLVHCSEDGQYLFCTCSSKVTVLNTNDGRIVKSLEKDEGDEITCFAVSRDIATVVTGLKSGLLQQWDCEKLAVTRTWKSFHVGPIACMAFDGSSTLLASGGSDSSIKVWDLLKQYCTHNLKGSQGVFSVVCFHPNIKRLQVFGSASDNSIRVWDLTTSKLIASLDGHFSTVTSVAITKDGNTMLSCARDKVVIIWDIVQFQQIKTLPVFETVESLILLPEERKISALNVTSERLHFITAGDKGVLKVWNAQSGRAVYTQEDAPTALPEGTSHEGPVITKATYIPGTDSVMVVTYEHHILLQALEGFSLMKQFVGYNDEILDLKYLGESETHIAVATNSPIIKLFEISTFSCQLLKGHTDIVLALDVFPNDPRLLASGSKDNTVILWRMEKDTFEMNRVFKGHGHTHSVTALASSRLGNHFLATVSKDTTLKVWHIPAKVPLVAQVESGAPLTAVATEHAHEKDINSVAIAPNDKLIATGSQDKTIKVWMLQDLNLLLVGTMRGHRKGIWCIQFSPVDKVLASSSADGLVKIWSLSDHSCLKTFEGHECSVLKVSFISSGMQLISAASDGNVKLWTIKLNECVKTFDNHADKLWALTVSKKEDFIVTGGADSVLIMWKDVTIEEQEEEQAKKDDLILKEQELQNLLLQKKWLKALRLAIILEQPFRALNIIKEILIEPNGQEELANTIAAMRPDQIDALLKFATTWNTNSKHCEASQAFLSTVLQSYLPEELLKMASIKENVEGLLPYTERHLQRIKRLNQQATFLEFLWQNMRIRESNDL